MPAKLKRMGPEPKDRLIGEAECREVSGLSRAQRWRLERDGKFPQRIALGPRTVRWRLNDVMAWIGALQVGGLSQPAGPGRSAAPDGNGAPAAAEQAP